MDSAAGQGMRRLLVVCFFFFFKTLLKYRMPNCAPVQHHRICSVPRAVGVLPAGGCAG